MKTKDLIVCKNASDWRAWLRRNHAKRPWIWLVFFKDERAKSYINYDQALDEAICFGWVDNLVKRVDAERYGVRFTKRREKSKWTTANKARAERLIAEKRMTRTGYATIEAAKSDGSWDG
jgi:uncharacterized protein YdeI (YjbR/CyaY-like superfamily)